MTDADTTQGGMGCFAKGCLVSSVVGLTLFVLLFGGTWFLYKKAVERFTSPQPAQITTEKPTDAQLQSANEMFERLRTAAASNQRETIEFTATDLNALIARHPSFANPRRQVRVSMINSIISVEMSVPFDHPPLPGLKGRWFNCTASFGLEYAYGQFTFDLKSLVANGHPAPAIIFSESFISSFNRSFTKSFMDSVRRSPEGKAFWENVKSITVRDDRLVVMTEPGG